MLRCRLYNKSPKEIVKTFFTTDFEGGRHNEELKKVREVMKLGFACKYMHPIQTLNPKILKEHEQPIELFCNNCALAK